MTAQAIFNPLEKNAHLIELCKMGDPRAQQQVYQKYLRAMSRVALRITGDEMEAEDVIQEAFVRAFRNLTNFKGEATFGAWLKRIVVNTSINHVKRRKAEFVPLEPERLEIPEEHTQAPKYVSTFSMDMIKDAVEQLPDGYRTVFSLYLFEGYDHQEIGNILNISEATSKSQFSRAKKKLRELLAAA